MKGYKCINKTAEEILTTMGFDPNIANRGWVMERTAGKENNGAPIRMHAIVHEMDGVQYIDIHADYPGPNNTHVSSRGFRTQRWNQLFEQIDHDQPCDAGPKILQHYGALKPALKKYHSENE